MSCHPFPVVFVGCSVVTSATGIRTRCTWQYPPVTARNSHYTHAHPLLAPIPVDAFAFGAAALAPPNNPGIFPLTPRSRRPAQAHNVPVPPRPVSRAVHHIRTAHCDHLPGPFGSNVHTPLPPLICHPPVRHPVRSSIHGPPLKSLPIALLTVVKPQGPRAENRPETKARHHFRRVFGMDRPTLKFSRNNECAGPTRKRAASRTILGSAPRWGFASRGSLAAGHLPARMPDYAAEDKPPSPAGLRPAARNDRPELTFP